MRKIIYILLLVNVLFLFTSCSKNDELSTVETTSPSSTQTNALLVTATPVLSPTPEALPTTKVNSTPKALSNPEKLLKSMTLKEKIAQLFIVTPEALKTSSKKSYSVTSFDSQMQKMLKKYPVGGVVLFSGNISTPMQVKKLINSLQKSSDIPLFVSVDEEGGSVARIGNAKKFDVPKIPNMQAIGATKDTNKAYKTGVTIGTYIFKEVWL